MTEKVKFLDQGTYFIQVLALEALQPGGPRVQECFVIPVMSRASGVLLALPAGYLTESLLQAGMTAGPEDLIGPSKQLTVPGVWEEVDGTELSSGEDIEVVLVDFHRRILEQVRDFEPVTEGPGILAFSADHAEVFPESSSLLLGTYSWLEEGGEGRTQYYSAEEPVTSALPVEPAPKANASKARAKSSPGGPSAPSKRVTTATLAEQLAEISKSLPVLSSRLDQVFERQTRVEGLLSSPTAPASSSVPAQRRPFEVSGYQGPKPSPTAFLRTIGSPPRVQALKESPHQDRHVSFPEDEPKQIPSEPDFALANPPRPDLRARGHIGGYFPAVPGSCNIGGSSCQSGWLLRSWNCQRVVQHVAEGLGEEREIDERSIASAWRFSAQDCSECLQEVEAVGECPTGSAWFQGESHLLKVCREEWRFCRSEGPRPLHVASLSDCRCHGEWRRQGCSGVAGPGYGCSGAECSGRREVGGGLDSFPTGGPTDRGVFQQACFDQSKAPGFLSSMPCRVGCDRSVLCQGGGYHQYPSPGGAADEERWPERPRGGGSTEEETSTVPKETQARRRSERLSETAEQGDSFCVQPPLLTTGGSDNQMADYDVLCSGSSDSFCQDDGLRQQAKEQPVVAEEDGSGTSPDATIWGEDADLFL